MLYCLTIRVRAFFLYTQLKPLLFQPVAIVFHPSSTELVPLVSCHLKSCLSVLYYTTHLLKHQEKYPPWRRLYLPLADTAGTDYIVTNLRLTGCNSCISKCYFSFYLFVWMYHEHFVSTVLSILFSGQCNVFR